MGKATYDPTKMRSGSSDITSELKTFISAKTAIDNIVTNLHNNWDDDENRLYTSKYNSEAKVAGENVQKIMEAFATLLEESAAAWEKVQNSNRTGLK